MNNSVFYRDLEKIFKKIEQNPEYLDFKKRKKKLFELLGYDFTGFDEEKNLITWEKEIEKFFTELNKKLTSESFALYGIGGSGIIFFRNFCKRYKKFPSFVLDKLESWDGYKIYIAEQIGKEKVLQATPENFSLLPKDILIIVTAWNEKSKKEIKSNLLSNGFKNIIFLPRAWKIYSKNFYDNMLKFAELKKEFLNYEAMKKCLEILEDEKSKSLFLSILRDILFIKNETHSDLWEEHYFPEDITLTKGYSKFIDCGSWIGDTIMRLRQKIGKVNGLVAFEPEIESFNELKDWVLKEGKEIASEVILFPCGVWKKTATLKFKKSVGKSGDSCIDLYVKEGEIITVVALDDVLFHWAPTFIKMDIEGAEPEALEGARKIIKTYSPDLAISIYHLPEHLWQIPLYIKSINPNYRLFLRKYNSQFVLELVLYATL